MIYLPESICVAYINSNATAPPELKIHGREEGDFKTAAGREAEAAGGRSQSCRRKSVE